MFFIAITMFTPKQYHLKQPLKTVPFGKTVVAFNFDEKPTQNNYVISPFKRLSSPVFFQLITSFQFHNLILKTEECRVSKNIELKTWR